MMLPAHTTIFGVGGGRLLHSIQAERYRLECHVKNSILDRAGSQIVVISGNLPFLPAQIHMDPLMGTPDVTVSSWQGRGAWMEAERSDGISRAWFVSPLT